MSVTDGAGAGLMTFTAVIEFCDAAIGSFGALLTALLYVYRKFTTLVLQNSCKCKYFVQIKHIQQEQTAEVG
jgi:hypothetical protein